VHQVKWYYLKFLIAAYETEVEIEVFRAVTAERE
jgi:hypothetical protein